MADRQVTGKLRKLLQSNSRVIVDAIKNDLLNISMELKDKGIIPASVYRKVSEKQSDTETLASQVEIAISNTLESSPRKFPDFLEILDYYAPDVASDLTERYEAIVNTKGAGLGQQPRASLEHSSGGKLQQADGATPISSKQRADLKELRKKCIQDLLCERTSDLEDVISADLHEFAKHLFGKKLIRKPLYDMVVKGVDGKAPAQLAAQIASTIGTKLNVSPELFQEYNSVVGEFSPDLAKQMEKDYRERLERQTEGTPLRDYIAGDFPAIRPEPGSAKPVQELGQGKRVTKRAHFPDGGRDETDNGHELPKTKKRRHDPVYPMNSKPHHGQAIVINLLADQYPVESNLSVQKFRRTFVKLGYEIQIRQPHSGQEMETLLEQDNKIKKGDDSFVCCIMAHGKNGKICIQDGSTVDLKLLQNIVNAKNCPDLFGCPKIFIIQACRGSKSEPPVARPLDSSAEKLEELPISMVAQLSCSADFFTAYCTTEDHIGVIQDDIGCPYLNELCSVFDENAEELSLNEMVMEVHHNLADIVMKVRGDKGIVEDHIEMGQVTHTLRGPVYFKKN